MDAPKHYPALAGGALHSNLFFIIMEEVWKDIPGYVGKYQVSTFGRVRSLSRMVTGKGLKLRSLSGRILRQSTKAHYNTVHLGHKNSKKVHRLIAITFIPNVNNYPQVNHIDGNKKNNHVTNLEWCTQSQNQKHAYLLGLQKPFSIGKKGRPIIVFDMEGNELKRYNKIKECAEDMGLRVNSIRRVLVGRRNHYHKFKFKYL